MEGNDEIDMTDDVVKFCVSWTLVEILLNITNSCKNCKSVIFSTDALT